MATARYFDSIDDNIVCSIGNCNFQNSAFTIAALIRRNTNGEGNQYIHGQSASGGISTLFMFNTSDQLILIGGSTPKGTTTLQVADSWGIVAVSKATGTQTPRFHIYKNGSWTHENADSSLAHPTGNQDAVYFDSLTPTLAANGNMDRAVHAVWTYDLTDAEIEWYTAWDRAGQWLNCDGLWSFQQASVSEDVVDLTGGGADQTAIVGTSVLNDGPDSDFYGTSEVVGTIDNADGLTVDVLMIPDGQ